MLTGSHAVAVGTRCGGPEWLGWAGGGLVQVEDDGDLGGAVAALVGGEGCLEQVGSGLFVEAGEQVEAHHGVVGTRVEPTQAGEVVDGEVEHFGSVAVDERVEVEYVLLGQAAAAPPIAPICRGRPRAAWAIAATASSAKIASARPQSLGWWVR